MEVLAQLVLVAVFKDEIHSGHFCRFFPSHIAFSQLGPGKLREYKQGLIGFSSMAKGVLLPPTPENRIFLVFWAMSHTIGRIPERFTSTVNLPHAPLDKDFLRCDQTKR